MSFGLQMSHHRMKNQVYKYIGDFNSHHSPWKYKNDDDNGFAIVNWLQHQNLNQLFNAKDIGTFQSGRWRRDYNPNLCFISSNTNGQPIHVTRQILMGFLHSQHRPVIIEVRI